jgi:hypothetical protein
MANANAVEPIIQGALKAKVVKIMALCFKRKEPVGLSVS